MGRKCVTKQLHENGAKTLMLQTYRWYRRKYRYRYRDSLFRLRHKHLVKLQIYIQALVRDPHADSDMRKAFACKPCLLYMAAGND
jgi:hypothetical protein